MPSPICCLGFVNICTKRAPQGIAECEHALALDRNLAGAHAMYWAWQVFIGRAEETEAHIASRPCASVRATHSLTLVMQFVGMAKIHLGSRRASGRVASAVDRGQPKLSRRPIFTWAPPSRSLAGLTRRVPQSRPVSRSTRPSLSHALRRFDGRPATTQRYLAECERLFEGLRKAGCRRNEASLKAACGSGCDARRLSTGRSIRA